MPRFLALAATLALPFLVRDPDDGAGGGAAVAENPAFDPADLEREVDFDALMAGEGREEARSPFEVEDAPFPGAEEPEGEKPDGEEPAEPGEKAKEGEPPALPEKIDVEGAEVPLADLIDAYKGLTPELRESAEIYDAMIGDFFTTPKHAANVVRVLLDKAFEVYGERDPKGFAAAFEGLGLAPASLPSDFDAETASPNEKALMTQNAALVRKIGAMQTEFQRTLDELKPVVQDRALAQAGDAHAATVNATVAGASVTGPQIVAMMKETGLDDPVMAFKVANFDKAVASARTGEEKPKDTMPRQGAQKTYDPNDPDLTMGERIRLMEAGYVPVAKR